MAGIVSGIGFSYPAPAADRKNAKSLVGTRLPDMQLHHQETAETFALYDLFRAGKFVLIDQSGGLLSESCAAWGDRVLTIQATVRNRPELAGLPGILCRPDGYCAWSGNTDPSALRESLAFWCGEPRRTQPHVDLTA
jgi:hypothetical protein